MHSTVFRIIRHSVSCVRCTFTKYPVRLCLRFAPTRDAQRRGQTGFTRRRLTSLLAEDIGNPFLAVRGNTRAFSGYGPASALGGLCRVTNARINRMTAQLFKLPAKSRSRSTKSYQLRVELKGVKPAVWRRIAVPSTIKLSRLHTSCWR